MSDRKDTVGSLIGSFRSMLAPLAPTKMHLENTIRTRLVADRYRGVTARSDLAARGICLSRSCQLLFYGR